MGCAFEVEVLEGEGGAALLWGGVCIGGGAAEGKGVSGR